MKKKKLLIRTMLLAMAVGIAYSISPTIYALSPLLIPVNVKFMMEKKRGLGEDEKIRISSSYDPTKEEQVIVVEDLQEGKQKHFRIKRNILPLPKDGLRKLSDDEKAAFLLRIKELLELENTTSSGKEISEGEWEVFWSEDEAKNYDKLDSVKEQLEREIGLGVINDEQANQVIENIQNGSYEGELEQLKAEVVSQQEKVEAVNALQNNIFEAVKEGTVRADQADEMLINLENGILDIEEGGIVFDLSKELSS